MPQVVAAAWQLPANYLLTVYAAQRSHSPRLSARFACKYLCIKLAPCSFFASQAQVGSALANLQPQSEPQPAGVRGRESESYGHCLELLAVGYLVVVE